MQGQITNNDPQLLWLNRDYAHPIDTARYRYMNVKFKSFPLLCGHGRRSTQAHV